MTRKPGQAMCGLKYSGKSIPDKDGELFISGKEIQNTVEIGEKIIATKSETMPKSAGL